MTESIFLQWIRKYQKIISVSALENYLGLPNFTIARALTGTRPMPEKHLEEFERKMAEIVNSSGEGLMEAYFDDMYNEYRLWDAWLSKYEPSFDTRDAFAQRRLMNEQVQTCMMNLYILLYRKGSPLADTVYIKLVKLNPGIMKGIKMQLLSGQTDVHLVAEPLPDPGKEGLGIISPPGK